MATLTARRPAIEAGDEAECCAPAVAPPLSAEEAERHAAVLKALADPHRLRMLALIAAQPEDCALCACDVEGCFELSQPTVSHHLKVLREAGLISVSKQGLWHYYAAVPEALAPVRELLGALGGASALSGPVKTAKR